MRKEYIKTSKEVWNKIKHKISFPTFKCKYCGGDVLDIPSNYHLKSEVANNKSQVKDMTNNLVKMLKAEIEWCKKYEKEDREEFYEGFVKGLNQAIYLIKEYDDIRTNSRKSK